MAKAQGGEEEKGTKKYGDHFVEIQGGGNHLKRRLDRVNEEGYVIFTLFVLAPLHTAQRRRRY